jgi:hypothetical protein
VRLEGLNDGNFMLGLNDHVYDDHVGNDDDFM